MNNFYFVAIIFAQLFFTRCSENYKNKHQLIANWYEVKSINIDTIYSNKNELHLNFNIRYYSDSSEYSFVSGGREKGMKGSKQKLKLLNTSYEDCGNVTFESSELNCDQRVFEIVDHFIEAFNNHERCVIGQKLEKGIKLKLDSNCLFREKNVNSITLGLFNKKANSMDTVMLRW